MTDDEICRDAQRWHELRAQLAPLLDRRAKIEREHFAAFGGLAGSDPRGFDGADLVEIEMHRPYRSATWRIYAGAYEDAGAGVLEDEIKPMQEEQDRIENRLAQAAPIGAAAALALARACLAMIEDHVAPDGDDWPEPLFRAGERAIGAIAAAGEPSTVARAPATMEPS